MQPTFLKLGLEFFDLIRAAAPLCPEIGQPGEAEQADPQTVSAWAEKMFNFKPSVKQAEVLDIDAKYMILCCNRQWGKTTTIALKSLHRALTMKDASSSSPEPRCRPAS
jgi:hypothetical protein